MNHALIAISFLTIAAALLLTAFRNPEHRSLTVGAGVFTFILGGYGAWLAWFVQPPQVPDPDIRGERLITVHGFGEPPSVDQRVPSEENVPERVVAKLGCGVCHQIPGMTTARSGVEGPLLIPRATAVRRLGSPQYRDAVTTGRATAHTPREYILESILTPNAFIVPGFEQRGIPSESAMPGHFARAITVAELDRLVDYLMTLDCDAAIREGLTGPRVEPIEGLCGTRRG
jgi:hypothetical protein